MATSSSIDRLNLAQVSFSEGRYADALTGARDILAAEPENPEALRLTGYCEHAQHNFPAALQAFETQARVSPDDPQAHYGVGLVQSSQNRHADALASYELALQRDPNFSYAQQGWVNESLYVAEEHLAMGREQQGIALLEQALRRGGQDSRPLVRLVQHWNQKGDKPRATQLLQAGVQRGFASPEITELEIQLGLKQPAQVAAPAGGGYAGPLAGAKCPYCQADIMSSAILCPTCGERLQITDKYLAAQRAKDPWQYTSYKIMAWLWIALAIVDIAAFLSFLSGGVRLIIGIGLLTENDLAITFARWGCYLGLLGGAFQTVVGFGFGAPLVGLLGIATLFMSGFQIYLLNYVDGQTAF